MIWMEAPKCIKTSGFLEMTVETSNIALLLDSSCEIPKLGVISS